MAPIMDFQYSIPWSKHFYLTQCGHCQQPGTASSPLKRCTGCDCFYYCSRDHQQKHWPDHKTLCKFIAKKKEEGAPLFGGFTGKTRFDMMKQLHTDGQLYQVLNSKVEKIFMSPPVCRKTGCLAPGGKEGLVSCPDCLSVSWCSDLHLAEAKQHHQQFCHDLKLARVADSLEDKHGLSIIVPPAIPYNEDLEYEAGAQNMVQHLSIRVLAMIGKGAAKDYGVKDCDNGVLQFIFTSDLLSGPLTLFEAARKTLPDLGTRESLTVHIAGAEGMDLYCLEKWDYLSSLLPALKVLEISFVDPQLNKQLEANNNKKAKTSKLGQSIKHSFYKMPYQQFNSGLGAGPELWLLSVQD